MHVFTCHCLNIQISCRGPTPPLQDVAYVHFTEMIGTDSFFSPNAFVVTLDLGGVTKSQKSLCKERCLNGWTVITCTCCEIEMFAQYVDDHDRVLVTHHAEQNLATIRELMQSHRYSNLFNLVLPEVNDNFIQNNIGIELQNSNLETSIEQVQSVVSDFLRTEQRNMEERIRNYTETQQAHYAALLQKVRKHKQAMIYLLLKSKENEASTESDTVGEPPVAPPATVMSKDTGGSNESSTSTDSAFDKSESSEHSHERTRKLNVRSLRRTMSNPARPVKPKKEHRRPPVHIDVGGVFDMEEFDSKEEYSDIDSEDSENSTVDDDVHEKEVERIMCATSLPMSIPTFSHHPHASVVEDDDDDYRVPLPKDPEQIAASMRALACSVRDGTEMFGELPRRRLNTGELLSSRPL